jgi:hypothetical protein
MPMRTKFGFSLKWATPFNYAHLAPLARLEEGTEEARALPGVREACQPVLFFEAGAAFVRCER